MVEANAILALYATEKGSSLSLFFKSKTQLILIFTGVSQIHLFSGFSDDFFIQLSMMMQIQSTIKTVG